MKVTKNRLTTDEQLTNVVREGDKRESYIRSVVNMGKRQFCSDRSRVSFPVADKTGQAVGQNRTSGRTKPDKLLDKTGQIETVFRLDRDKTRQFQLNRRTNSRTKPDSS